jgi:hypothetical protein
MFGWLQSRSVFHRRDQPVVNPILNPNRSLPLGGVGSALFALLSLGVFSRRRLLHRRHGTGSTSTDWTNPANWAGGVPTTGSVTVNTTAPVARRPRHGDLP